MRPAKRIDQRCPKELKVQGMIKRASSQVIWSRGSSLARIRVGRPSQMNPIGAPSEQIKQPEQDATPVCGGKQVHVSRSSGFVSPGRFLL